MEKLKLELQMFASTNKTTHYELSQYSANDKPTYLVDYNADMLKIDTGIYNSQSKADTNAASIGPLSNLTTEVKSDLVGAINEVDGHVDTNTGNISANALAIASNTSHIGDITDLKTTDKSSLVGATNDIYDYLNLTDFHQLSNPQVLNSSDQPMTGASCTSNMSVALNSDGTFGKIYGNFSLSGITGFPRVKFINTGIKGITEDITISPMGFIYAGSTIGVVYGIISPPASGETSASITFRCGVSSGTPNALLFPCMYYFTQFGDVPTV